MVLKEERREIYTGNYADNSNRKSEKHGWTLYLILCSITVCSASFQFGYNIGSTNLPTPKIKKFYEEVYYSNNNTNIIDSTSSVSLNKENSENEEAITLLWTLTTALFVVGGMIGAFSSKFILDKFGRKNGILFHYGFTIIGSLCVFICYYVKRPELMMVSRFLFGIQGGMSCGLIPTYLSEISPPELRGATGVMHQLCLTVGIMIAQTLGFRQFLGTSTLWHILLALPIVPCILGGFCLLFWFPETPRALLIDNKDEAAARIALIRLRNSSNIADEIDQIIQEAKENQSNQATISLKELFTFNELRWPLITGLILQLAQQLCGINAIFFYSESIFKSSLIPDEFIQYCVFLTGVINVICTIVCVPLIDRLGRKPLLVFPMIFIIIDFIALTVFLNLKDKGIIYSYLSIVCIILFIMCFSVGLGPIPFIYVAECFRQDARSAALAICMFTNWVANLVLTLTFPYLAKLLTNYVFLVFTVIVLTSVAVIIKKVPETKNRNIDEIMIEFEGKKIRYHRSNNLLMKTTNA